MTPCQDPGNNPDDWFIDRTGRQYSDDVLVTDEDVTAELGSLTESGVPEHEMPSYDDVKFRLEDEVLRTNLMRRRHAKDKCFVECKARMACLNLAMNLEDPTAPTIDHGTFGGYHEEERRKILQAVAARRNTVGATA